MSTESLRSNMDDVLLFFAANETLACLGGPARPSSQRLLEPMIDRMSVERHIDAEAAPPEPLTMDSTPTRQIAEA